MDQRLTVKVFRNSNGNPTILAYAFLSTKYLTVIYFENMLFAGMASFDDLMNLTPIQSTSLVVRLPILNNLRETIDVWGKKIEHVSC